MTRNATQTVNLTDAATIKEIRKDDIIIALVGPIGSGKTHFIDVLANRQRKNTHPGGSLAAKGNRDIHAVRVKHKAYGDRIVLLETPGFESGHHGDIGILQVERKIKSWLQKQFVQNISTVQSPETLTSCNDVALTGIVYLQQISSPQGPPNQVEFMYKDLCGSGPISRIILVTTMWHEIQREAGERQHEEFSRSWDALTHSESSVHPFRDDSEGNTNSDALRQNAWDLVLSLIRKHNERDALLLRQELTELQNELCKTEEGTKVWTLLEEIIKTRLQIQRELSRLELARHIAEELEREEERLEHAMQYLNRFRGGSGDHSVLLTRLISLVTRE